MKIYDESECLDQVLYTNPKCKYIGYGDEIFEVESVEEMMHLFNFPIESFQIIIRTTLESWMVEHFFLSNLGRIYNYEVTLINESIRLIDDDTRFLCSAYNAEFRLLKPTVWSDKLLSYLIFYTLRVICLIDYPSCPAKSLHIAQSNDDLTIAYYVYFLLKECCISAFEPGFFIHDGMAKLLKFLAIKNNESNNNRERRERRSPTDYHFELPRSVKSDLEMITSILNRRNSFSDALEKAKEFNVSTITEKMIDEFENIRRRF